jgi:hypothetical protein
MSAPESRPPRRRGWVLRIGVTLLAVAALLGVAYAVRHAILKRKLADAIADMDRDFPGWKIEELEAARKPVADADNSALVVLQIAGLLPAQVLKTLESEVVESDRADANILMRDNQAEETKKFLNEYQPAVLLAHRLANMPSGHYPVRWEDGFLVSGASYNAVFVAGLLQRDLRLQLQSKNTAAAFRDCRALINLSRSVGDELFVSGQSVRFGILNRACRCVDWLLNQSEPDPAALMSLQKILEQEEPDQLFERLVKIQAAYEHTFLQKLEAGNSEMEKSWFSVWEKGPVEKSFPFLSHDRIVADHIRLLKQARRFRELALVPAHKRSGLFVELQEEFDPLLFVSSMPSCGWYGEYVSFYSADGLRLAHVRCTIAALAAERYRQQHGSWPASLGVIQGLTPVKLIDPFDGQPLRYRKLDDGFILYSVGPDQEDNGGEIKTGYLYWRADAGIRLWDVARRRQPAPPKP